MSHSIPARDPARRKSPSTRSFVDIARLREVSDGQETEMQELARLYVRTMKIQLQTLEQAVRERKSETVAQTAHSAAGASAMIGMTAVVAALRRMERLGQTKNLRRAAVVQREIRRAFSDICGALSSPAGLNIRL